MPSYSLGEKQVAGIKYGWGHYYGKVIQSVEKSGRQRTSVEVLSEEWIKKNTIESFRQLLRKKQNMFIWAPVGDARPDSYPYDYEKHYLQSLFHKKIATHVLHHHFQVACTMDSLQEN
jgi:uncharacterized protein VirK/YbjX